MLIHKLNRPFADPSSGIVYRGWIDNSTQFFSLPDPAVQEGLLLRDSLDNQLYFVQETGAMIYNGRVTHRQSRVTPTNCIVEIQRFQTTPEDGFGRSASPDPEIIASNMPAYLNTATTSLDSSPDRTQSKQKIHFLVQHTDVLPGDRVVIGAESKFRVIHINPHEFVGLYVVTAITDNR